MSLNPDPLSQPQAPLENGTEPTHGISPFDAGLLVGLLIGEGHFGGDGRQPQITLRMHVAHEAVFRWLVARVPGSRLYGPYDHAGRRYFQWMARGKVLREWLIPVLDQHLLPDHSGRVWGRYQEMKARYHLGDGGGGLTDVPEDRMGSRILAAT